MAVNDEDDPFKGIETDTIGELEHDLNVLRNYQSNLVPDVATADQLVDVDEGAMTSGGALTDAEIIGEILAENDEEDDEQDDVEVDEVDDEPELPPSVNAIEDASSAYFVKTTQ